MKKLMIVFALTALLGITSCVKSWNCQCIENGQSVTNNPINGGTFLHAEHACNSMKSGSSKCSLLTDSK